MKCDVCKEGEATVHLTQIIAGKMQKIDLCETCAKAKGVSDPTGFSLADLLLGLGQPEGSAADEAPATEFKCPACQMTQSDFKKAGRLGCPQCYETFAEPLAPMLKGMHKGERHIGKIPPSHTDVVLTDERLKRLREDLQAAVKAENFEAAAKLRDQIRLLDQKHGSKIESPPSP